MFCPEGASFLRKAMALDLAVYLPGLGLAYNDRASMEHSVEVRVPWLDLDLVRWSMTLPDSVLIRRRRAKWLSKELAARVISPQVAWRAKRGFAAPAQRVAAGRPPGSQGFRQGRYFALATSILELHGVVPGERPIYIGSRFARLVASFTIRPEADGTPPSCPLGSRWSLLLSLD